MRDPRHADAAFRQVHLAAHQRPVVGKALAAVVTGKHHQGVVTQAVFFKRLHDPANAFVHVVDHAAVAVDVAALQVKNIVSYRGGNGFVVTAFPRPVRRGVVQAQEKKRGLLRHAIDVVNGVV